MDFSSFENQKKTLKSGKYCLRAKKFKYILLNQENEKIYDVQQT